MQDPFLLAHAVDNSCKIFDLSNRTPVSIKDQMIRANHLIFRMVKHGLFGVGSNILIIGAGVAGVTSAILAAGKGINVTLAEKDDQPFRFQREVKSRWINPVYHDWPMDHFKEESWPKTEDHPYTPLWFKSQFADELAEHWNNRLASAIYKMQPRLRVQYNTKISLPTEYIVNSKIIINHEYESSLYQDEYDGIVYCTGILGENTAIGKYNGPDFWSTDNFQDKNFGLENNPNRVVVVGAGDGGLQDYIRLVTGRNSAFHVLDEIFDFKKEHPLLHKMSALIFNQTQISHREWMWSEGGVHDHYYLQDQHNKYCELVEAVVGNKEYWGDVISKIRIITSERQIGKVRLIHPCSHFDNCYPINHFTALLLNKFIEREFGDGSIISGKFVHEATPWVDSNSIPGYSWGSMQNIEVTDSYCRNVVGSGSSVRDNDRERVALVVRNGIKRIKDVLPKRQLLPCKLIR